ncbi:FAD/NAD(P)-binding domain-containing protein [Ramaria rubella]|nr:FAD/NAD(P)-binding domain-containing protein [Ramaria rubella]
MSTPRVLIIGAGIAGPVLAILLKMKGYAPVIYEKNMATEAGGIALMLQPNGLKLLNLIPGVYDRIPGVNMEQIRILTVIQSKVLAEHKGPSRLKDITGFPMRGCLREDFHKWIADMVEEHGIEIHWGHKFVSLQQSDETVTATFENGTTATGSFLIGCDGLHSRVRGSVFQEDRPQYMGLSQTSGYTPIPPWFKENIGGTPTLYNYFGEAMHMVAYPTGNGLISWFVTARVPEEKESWNRVLSTSEIDSIKKSVFAKWGFGAGELVQNSSKYIKYGLYERKDLETWHKDRVVLLGDAAHPMPPHVGQGANQSFEDIYHLLLALKKHGVDSKSSAPTADLQAAFTDYETARMQRASMIVQRSKFEGNNVRVVEGAEACIKRDEMAGKFWQEENFLNVFKDFGNHPFVSESAI